MTTKNSDLRPAGAETPDDSSSPDVPMVPMGTDAFQPPSKTSKPKFVFWPGDRVKTARDVSDVLRRAPNLFDRSGPVRLVKDGNTMRIEHLTPEMVAIELSNNARVFRASTKGEGEVIEKAVSLPLEEARMYLHLNGEHGLRPLKGITSMPILHLDGRITCATGYDPDTGLLQHNVPALNLPERPTYAEAAAALASLRYRFSTFPFADAEMVHDPALGILRVRQDRPPGLDESSYLAGLLTAVARASLPLTPGMVIRAAVQSGSGTGKGLLAKCAALVATGTIPEALTAGHDTGEMDKRLNSSLLRGAEIIFLDNVNSTSLRSDTLASAVTEPKVQLRALGSSTPISIDCRSFIMITGNGVQVSEDLVSRFLFVELDARTGDPETRRMPAGFLDSVAAERGQILNEALKIIRYGLQNPYPGLPLRNFDGWAQMCRDGLLVLGATDPVTRLEKVKASDPMREHHTTIMLAWQAAHKSDPVAANDLKKPVADLIAPNASRQELAAKVRTLVGMRIGNMQIIQARQATKNSPTLYMLVVEPG
jgi:hypothetical protein